jgi:hypothetical protein
MREAEVLVSGSLTLVEKVTLRSILEELDLLETVPAPAVLDPPPVPGAST